MKKLLAILLCCALCAGFAACGSGTASSAAATGGTAASAPTLGVSATGMPEVLNPTEYTLYQNMFFNDMAKDYEGQSFTKEGIFTTIRDSFNNVTRHYVWGYADTTKCCDWQWELVLPEGAELPANGSKITATGTWKGDENALDKYWLTDAVIEVEQAYQGPSCDWDLTTMSSTLARVQIQNMQSFPDEYDGKYLYVYSRVYDLTQIQHPYYDSTWYMTVTGQTLPAIGTPVTVGGVFTKDDSGCHIEADSVQEN
jgi:hypothetical protein